MTRLVVGVADCLVSSDPEGALVTYALGSCIGLVVFDPAVRVAGLLHFMLPDSTIDPERARQNPWMFADTGIPRLFHAIYGLGGEKRRLIVRAAGGAQVLDDHGFFNVGKRNCLTLRKILWRAGVMLENEETGGTISRSIRLEVGTGRLWLRTAGERERELGLAATARKGC